jgi:hypothetical protein
MNVTLSIDEQTPARARELARQRGVSLNAGCRVLYSEDLQDGRRIDGLEVINPFRA